jgi:hypothetical protein
MARRSSSAPARNTLPRPEARSRTQRGGRAPGPEARPAPPAPPRGPPEPPGRLPQRSHRPRAAASTARRQPVNQASPMHHAAPAAGARTRSRLIRRGSASTISNWTPLSWPITSPRAGTRPERRKISPPSVSISSSSSPEAQRNAQRGLDLLQRRGGLRQDHAGLFSFHSAPSSSSCSSSISPITCLDQVLDGDQPVDPAIFVDHQRHMDALLLHLLQQHAVGIEGGA